MRLRRHSEVGTRVWIQGLASGRVRSWDDGSSQQQQIPFGNDRQKSNSNSMAFNALELLFSFDEAFYGELKFFAGVGCGDLGADAGFAHGDYWIRESYDIDALGEE